MALNLEWIVTGIILLGAMIFGGIHLWIKRRKDANNPTLYGSRIRPEFYEEDEK